MNPLSIFLVLIVLALGGGGYYEYTVMEKVQEDQAATIAANVQKIQDLNGTIDQLTADKKQLGDDKALLTKRSDDANSTIGDLNQHLQEVQGDLADTKQQLEAERAKPPPPFTDDLGTLQTPDRKSFDSCQLLKVDPDGIVVSYSGGIVKILYGWLSSNNQVRFGYNLLPNAKDVEKKVQEQMQKQNGGGASPAPSAGNGN